jgi:hypothetical protein
MSAGSEEARETRFPERDRPLTIVLRVDHDSPGEKSSIIQFADQQSVNAFSFVFDGLIDRPCSPPLDLNVLRIVSANRTTPVTREESTPLTANSNVFWRIVTHG